MNFFTVSQELVAKQGGLMQFVKCKSVVTEEIVLIPYHAIAKIKYNDDNDKPTLVETTDGNLYHCVDAYPPYRANAKLYDSIVVYARGSAVG